MDLSYEGLLTTILFLLPGFFVYHTRRYLQPAYADDPDNFELALLSLGYGTTISLTQSVVFAVALTIGGFPLSSLLVTPRSSIIAHPMSALVLLLLWTLSAIGLAMLVGTWDPYLRILRRLRRDSLHDDHDLWYRIFHIRRMRFGDSVEVGVTAFVANGDVYSGRLRDFETRPHEDNNRYFVLQNVGFWPGEATSASVKAAYHGDNSGVLLNTSNIDALVFHFVADERTAEKPGVGTVKNQPDSRTESLTSYD